MGAILLVRHGQASFGAEEYDALSELGVRQARVLGEALRDRGAFDLAVCGSMRRHRQTAEACLGAGLAVDVDAGWNEYDHEGVIAAHEPRYEDPAALAADLAAAPDPRRAFQALFSSAVARWVRGESGYAESFVAFRDRTIAAAERMTARLGKGATAIVFTSGGPISAICSRLLGMPDARALELQWTLANASVTKLIARGAELRVSTLNEHGWFERGDRALLTYR
jgi:broad specificity phosphatase PhoE